MPYLIYLTLIELLRCRVQSIRNSLVLLMHKLWIFVYNCKSYRKEISQWMIIFRKLKNCLFISQQLESLSLIRISFFVIVELDSRYKYFISSLLIHRGIIIFNDLHSLFLDMKGCQNMKLVKFLFNYFLGSFFFYGYWYLYYECFFFLLKLHSSPLNTQLSLQDFIQMSDSNASQPKKHDPNNN